MIAQLQGRRWLVMFQKAQGKNDSPSNNCRDDAHREIYSKSYYITPKSDCIYHAPIDLEQQTDSVCLLF